MTDAEARPPGCWPASPVEECGATAIIAAICGQTITEDIQSRRIRPPMSREQRLLQAAYAQPSTSDAGPCRPPPGTPVAEITAVLLPSRLPGSAADLLGITGSGAAPPAAAGTAEHKARLAGSRSRVVRTGR